MSNGSAGVASTPGQPGEVELALLSSPAQTGSEDEVLLYLVARREQGTPVEGVLRMVLPDNVRAIRAWSAYGQLLQTSDHLVVSRERASSRLTPWILVLAQVTGDSGRALQVQGDMAWEGGSAMAPSLLLETR